MTDPALAPFDEGVETYRPSAAIDPQRLEYLWTLAARIAGSSLVPESLRTAGPKNSKKDLPQEQVVANVFAVVEQADRWNISPFALLSCAAIVHGKLGFEGKVIAAVLKSRYGIDLNYDWTGAGESMSIIVSGKKPGAEKVLEIDGTVKGWRTTGDNSPWRPDTFKKMLAYRGAREWCRLHEPAAIMGVLGDDELYAIEMERRAQVARDVTPVLANRFGGTRGEGFSADNVRQIATGGQAPMETVDQKTGEILNTEVQRETTVNRTTSSAKAASAKSASTDADRGGATSDKDSRPNQSSEKTASPQSGSDEGGQAGDPPPRLSVDQFRKYASNMARMTSTANVDRASLEFWKENGGPPKQGTQDFVLGKMIYDKQFGRADGKIDADGLLDEIHADIDASFGGKEEL